MLRCALSHHGQCVEDSGGARPARYRRREARRAGSDENGDRRRSSERGHNRGVELLAGRAGHGWTEPSAAASGGKHMNLRIHSLRSLYVSGEATPSSVIAEVYDRIGRSGTQPVWISLVSRETALDRARELEQDPSARQQPLYGVPFAIKDNIDVAGLAQPRARASQAFTTHRPAPRVVRHLGSGAL